MRGVYECNGTMGATTAAATAIYLINAADMVLEILSASLTNTSNETNEQLEACLQRITTIGTPTATAFTPAPREKGDVASSVACKFDVTASEPSYTAATEVGRKGFPSLGGWQWLPTPEERLVVSPSESIGLRLLTASPTSLVLHVNIVFREIGG